MESHIEKHLHYYEVVVEGVLPHLRPVARWGLLGYCTCTVRYCIHIKWSISASSSGDGKGAPLVISNHTIHTRVRITVLLRMIVHLLPTASEPLSVISMASERLFYT